MLTNKTFFFRNKKSNWNSELCSFFAGEITIAFKLASTGSGAAIAHGEMKQNTFLNPLHIIYFGLVVMSLGLDVIIVSLLLLVNLTHDGFFISAVIFCVLTTIPLIIIFLIMLNIIEVPNKNNRGLTHAGKTVHWKISQHSNEH